jgi:hypothetical protein
LVDVRIICLKLRPIGGISGNFQFFRVEKPGPPDGNSEFKKWSNGDRLRFLSRAIHFVTISFPFLRQFKGVSRPKRDPKKPEGGGGGKKEGKGPSFFPPAGPPV